MYTIFQLPLCVNGLLTDKTTSLSLSIHGLTLNNVCVLTPFRPGRCGALLGHRGRGETKKIAIGAIV